MNADKVRGGQRPTDVGGGHAAPVSVSLPILSAHAHPPQRKKSSVMPDLDVPVVKASMPEFVANEGLTVRRDGEESERAHFFDVGRAAAVATSGEWAPRAAPPLLPSHPHPSPFHTLPTTGGGAGAGARPRAGRRGGGAPAPGARGGGDRRGAGKFFLMRGAIGGRARVARPAEAPDTSASRLRHQLGQKAALHCGRQLGSTSGRHGHGRALSVMRLSQRGPPSRALVS